MRNRRAPVSDVKLLQRVPYFASLPETELRALASCCRARQLGAGEVLYEEGQPCADLFIIAEGTVEIHQVSLRGREQVFHTEGPGATLGEAPLFDRGGFIATAVALVPARVLVLPRADLVDLCRRHPAVALAIAESLARRVRAFARIVTDLAFRPVTERLARHIESAAPVRPIAPGTVVKLSLTHAQLAARLGTVRELVARALGRLEDGGAISRERGRIVITDPVRLSALASGEG